MLELPQDVIIGTKQVLRALESDGLAAVYIANDAQEHILQKLMSALRGKDVEIIRVGTMQELGQACRISVKSATAAIPKT